MGGQQMENQVAAIREQIDKQTRPGQEGTATVANRLPTFGNLAGTKTTPGNVYHPATQSESRFGMYGRGRYGEARYLQVV